MELAEFLDQRSVAVDLEAKDKPQALKVLVQLAAQSSPFEDQPSIVQALEERESLVSTGIGHAIAVPHCKTGEAERLSITVGRFKEPVEFGSLDGAPVSLCFLLIAPKTAANSHLKALAKIARFAKNPEVRQLLLEAQGAQGLYQTIIEQDKLFS